MYVYIYIKIYVYVYLENALFLSRQVATAMAAAKTWTAIAHHKGISFYDARSIYLRGNRSIYRRGTDKTGPSMREVLIRLVHLFA